MSDRVGFFVFSNERLPQHPGTDPMDKSKVAMARQIAQAAIAVHQQETGRVPRVVTVAPSGVNLAVMPYRDLCSAQSVPMES